MVATIKVPTLVNTHLGRVKTKASWSQDRVVCYVGTNIFERVHCHHLQGRSKSSWEREYYST